jgi:hypothetical protein
LLNRQGLHVASGSRALHNDDHVPVARLFTAYVAQFGRPSG